ncbi:NAD(P)H-hydrate dehydratase [Anthocerotibacter panamensis]|uniref:NAD(P)H-hydrate dehydratase n=1 Tax=Anthocerotibacter panamensis TaxID=2857077 RepID=UPI001C404C93|nr:NAD(P)H-hydrate dehydratase [Anthocerotibacter panamensis]
MNPDDFLATAAETEAVETWTFDHGLPVAALMERAGLALTHVLQNTYPPPRQVGVLVGPGHNGADSLVVARELQLRGYWVRVYLTSDRLKTLTEQHLNYYRANGGVVVSRYEELRCADFFVDGIFGFGLTRAVTAPFADVIAWVNEQPQPVVSVDIPSGLHTDTGAVLGIAVQAERTFCLGLWKQGLFQDRALDYCKEVVRLDLGFPAPAIAAGVPQPQVRCITPEVARQALPLHRPLATHKYAVGRLLVVAGSQRFPGAAILAGLGAKASGVGLVGMAVPASLRDICLTYLPDAIYYPCPETPEGTIAQLAVDPGQFGAIACGPGLDCCPELVQHLIQTPVPLVLDADGLNVLGKLAPGALQRAEATVLTPHVGEFRRLFPALDPEERFGAARAAAQASGATVVLKGARAVVASPQGGPVWVNPQSTPALARAGSGDVLTGLLGGLLAQKVGALKAAQGAVWWHSQAALALVAERSVLGVDPLTLAQYLHQGLSGRNP